jgi:hypothetical protein
MEAILEKMVAFIATYLNENWQSIVAVIFILIALLCFKGTRNVLKAFFGINDSDTIASRAKKLSKLTIGRTIYAVADYWVAALLGAMIIYMKAYEYSYTAIILATWLYDFVFAVFFWIVSDWSKNDFTFGEAYRRAGNKMSATNNKFVGKILFAMTALWVSFKAIIWDGPEAIVIFYKDELKTVSRTIITLIILSGIQALFGAWLYTSIYKVWTVIF